MTVSTWQPDDSSFHRGHRVRFANGPIMTVMDYTENENGGTDIICGWWVEAELEQSVFHPTVLIHASPEIEVTEKRTPDDFEEFHSG